jgi:membrane protease subunit HflC
MDDLSLPEPQPEVELKRITSEAYRIAQEKMGKADAEATRIYAQAYANDPEFYSFVKSLGVYEKTMDKGTALVLSTDSDFLKYFKSYKDEGLVR